MLRNSYTYVFVLAAVMILSIGLVSAAIENTDTGATYATIQEAIDAASSGDTIMLGAGEIFTLADGEPVYLNVSDITLTTDSLNPATIRYEHNDYFPVLEVFASGTTIEYVHLVRENSAAAAQGIAIRNSGTTVQEVTVTGVNNENIAAISVDHGIPSLNYDAAVSNILIQDSTLTGNFGWGVLVVSRNDQGSLTDVIIQDNHIDTAVGGMAVWMTHSDTTTIQDLTIIGNTLENHATQLFDNGEFVDFEAFINDNTLDQAVILRDSLGDPTGDRIHSSIQNRIDAASTGQTVEVYPGTYIESLEILTDDLTLRSVNGAAATILDADGATNAIAIGPYTAAGAHPSGVTVEGFTVLGWAERGIAQRNGDGTVFIYDNFLEGPVIGSRNAIGISGGTGSEVIRNTISTSTFDQEDWSGTGILAMGSNDARIEDNYVVGADRGISVSAYPSWSGIDPTWASANNNVIQGNVIEASGVVAIAVDGDVFDTTVIHNIIENNDVGFWMFNQLGGVPSGVTIQENNFTDNPYALAFTSSSTSNTPVLRQNNILADTGVFSNLEVDARENWWGCSEGPSYMDCSSVAGSGDISYTPWLCEEAVTSLTSETDSCGLSTATINVLYYDENASWTQAQDKLRVWGQSPVGARTAIIDVRHLNQSVIESTSADVGAAGVNQGVYDEFFDINTWPEKRLQIHVSFEDSNGDVMEGYAVASMFNDLFLLALDDLVAEHEQQLQDLAAELDVLKDDVEANADEIIGLQQDVSDLKDAIQELQADVGALEDDFAALESDVADLVAAVESLEEDLFALLASMNHATISLAYFDEGTWWQDTLRVWGQAPQEAVSAEVRLETPNNVLVAKKEVAVGVLNTNENSYVVFFDDITSYERQELQVLVKFYDASDNWLGGYDVSMPFNNLYLLRVREDLQALNESIDSLDQSVLDEFARVDEMLASLIGHGTIQYRYYPETSEYKFQGAIPQNVVDTFNPRFWVEDAQGATVYETTNINDFKYGPHNPLHGEESFWKLIVDADALGSGVFTVNIDFDVSTTADRWSVTTISELAVEDLQKSVADLLEQVSDLNSGTMNIWYHPSTAQNYADSLQVYGQAPLGAVAGNVTLVESLTGEIVYSVWVIVSDTYDNKHTYDIHLDSFSQYPSAAYQVNMEFYSPQLMRGYDVSAQVPSGLFAGPYTVTTAVLGVAGDQYAQGVYWTNQQDLVIRSLLDDKVSWLADESFLKSFNSQGTSKRLYKSFDAGLYQSTFEISLEDLYTTRPGSTPEFVVEACGEPISAQVTCGDVVTIGYDTQAPQIALASLVPDESMIISGDFTFQANVTDNAVIANVEFSLINKTDSSDVYVLGNATNVSGDLWELVYDTTSITDGWYNYSVTAVDYAGNSETVMIDPLVDNTAPVIYDVSHSGYSGTGHTISAQISDAYAGVANATAQVMVPVCSEEQGGSETNVSRSAEGCELVEYTRVNLSLSEGTITNGTWSGSFDFEHLGDFEVVVLAADYANNQAASEGTSAEARLGFVVSLSPLSQTVNTGSNVQISGVVTPGLNLSEFTYPNSMVLVNGQAVNLEADGAFSAIIGTLSAGQTHTVVAQYTPGDWTYNNASDVFSTSAQVTVNPVQTSSSGGGGGGGGNIQTGVFLGDQPEGEEEVLNTSTAPEEESAEEESEESASTEDVFASQGEEEVPAQQPTEEQQAGSLLTAAVAGVGSFASSTGGWVLALLGLIAGGFWFAKRS